MTKEPTRDPLPPPFPVGTRLRCVDQQRGASYAGAVRTPRDISKHPEDWALVYGFGLEVTIDKVVAGTRGTGRQLRDEDGLMFYEDDGEPILDETRDGYSVYHVVAGDNAPANNSGRAIRAENADKWLVLDNKPGQPRKPTRR